MVLVDDFIKKIEKLGIEISILKEKNKDMAEIINNLCRLNKSESYFLFQLEDNIRTLRALKK
jgi:hypothetical protein